ncbi:AEG_G0016810.mRNA.1.CDS.1 [Saccharomyces cerevisiae]|nr:AEG_G0016810.mRNA.1.CDS.1 [Saccharomyces cerevisiae]CAI6642194.1 AEG_G0016810.mRNA.1.CDS.1 [Saccharomyces cerevisiae]
MADGGVQTLVITKALALGSSTVMMVIEGRIVVWAPLTPAQKTGTKGNSHLPPVTFPNQTVFWSHKVSPVLSLTKDPLRNLFAVVQWFTQHSCQDIGLPVANVIKE